MKCLIYKYLLKSLPFFGLSPRIFKFLPKLSDHLFNSFSEYFPSIYYFIPFQPLQTQLNNKQQMKNSIHKTCPIIDFEYNHLLKATLMVDLKYFWWLIPIQTILCYFIRVDFLYYVIS